MQVEYVCRPLFLLLLTSILVLASLTSPRADPQDRHLASLDVQLIETGVFGAASTYAPRTASEPAGMETASGELYDPDVWAAAIQTDLRDAFGGIHYGRNYRAAFALVECGEKRVIVRVNDVGPLMPGRIIDFNTRTMRYFDARMALGVLHNVTVTPLPGQDWVAGPVGDVDGTMVLSARRR